MAIRTTPGASPRTPTRVMLMLQPLWPRRSVESIRPRQAAMLPGYKPRAGCGPC